MSKDVAQKAKDSKPNIFKRIGRFFRDLRSEFKKIVWPTKKQTLNNTLVVLVCVAVSGIVIWSVDWVFINLFKLMF